MDKKGDEDATQTADMASQQQNGCSSESDKPQPTSKKQNGAPCGSGTFRGTFRVVYIGSAVLEKRHTIAMLPWIVAEIVRRNARRKQDVLLTLTDTSLNAVSMETGCCVFEHNLYTMSKFAQTNQDRHCFSYITRESADSFSVCHVFRSTNEETVLDLFTSVKEMTKEMAHHHQNKHALTYMGSSPSTEVTSSKWHHYEVLYVGKIKVSQKRAPPLFIDESVNKFRSLENDKRQRKIDNTDQKDTASLNEVKYTRKRASEQHTSISYERKKSLPEIFMSKDSCDRGVVETKNITEPCVSSPNLLSDSEEKSNLKPVVENCDTPSSPSKKSPLRHSKDSTDTLIPPSDHSLITHTQSLDAAAKEVIVQDLKQCATMKNERSEDETVHPPTRQTSLPVYCSRAENLRRIITTNSNTSRQPHNRTMLFVIGQLELCLLGTDKKQVLLRKCFKDISHCSQGIKNPDYFGFICKETSLTGIESYMGYIFCCQAAKVVDEIMHSLKQAFHAAHQEYQKHLTSQGEILFCETCPLHWFHRLCLDIEGLTTDKVQVVIIHRIASLPEADQEEIIRKYQGAEIKSLQEQNEIFMMILRGLCEVKQKNHIHIPNQGTKQESDKKTMPYLIGQFKARKQLPGPLELLLKIPTDSKRKITSSSSAPVTPTNPDKVLSPCEDKTVSEECPCRSNGETTRKEERRRKRQIEQKEAEEADKKQSHPPMSPLRHIFMKVGSQGKLAIPTQIKRKVSIKKGSWRQAMFQRVQAPLHDNIVCGNQLSSSRGKSKDISNETVRRSKTTLRALWKKAILEQILLIRMENENKKLQIIQDAAMEKRIKLAYEELVMCKEEAVDLWENILQSSVGMVDYKTLEEAVQTGVPHQRKGDIWLFLAEQYKLRNPLSACKNYDSNLDINVKYEDLLKQLTPHQHAILIDLGRTFPSHMYYKQTLGSGQLSLFNLLKGYSLLDPEVGYCQGLSFVAGVLLLHMTEEEAFEMMKHILFHLGFRDQYRPNMVALQVQLYQLSRLVHDNLHDLHLHFERYDVSPALYAAPWFLTLFSSQFPLGFVARLFDLIFLQGMEAVFKVALLLLTTHKDEVINLNTFESIVDYLKTTIPSINNELTTKVLEEAMVLDVSKSLHSYDVEYHVLQEEMLHNTARNLPENISRLELTNNELKQENQHLTEQLQATQTTVHNLESTLISYQSTIGKLQSRVRGLEDERDALLHSVNVLRKRLDKLDATSLDEPEHRNDVLLFIKEASIDDDSEVENACSHKQ